MLTSKKFNINIKIIPLIYNNIQKKNAKIHFFNIINPNIKN